MRDLAYLSLLDLAHQLVVREIQQEEALDVELQALTLNLIAEVNLSLPDVEVKSVEISYSSSGSPLASKTRPE